MKRKDVICCSFHNWYKIFEDISIESIVLPIPSEALNYLQDDGTLVLPHDPTINENEDQNTLDDETIEEDTLPLINLDEFTEKIKQAIRQLGENVFPKLNWSSPKDAVWITFNKSLQCFHPNDVYLLLKSSDFISRDLSVPFKGCEDAIDEEEKVDYYLVLRKWVEINPSEEFRCFVKDGRLIGITQREISQYYYYISKEKDNILSDIISFWDQHILTEFPLSSYVFDVYRPKKEKVYLIDFSPYGETTESLLFTWEELLSTDSVHDAWIPPKASEVKKYCEEIKKWHPEFRYIPEALGVQPNPYMRYGLPWDVVDLSNQDLSNLSNFLQNKMNMEGEEDEDNSCAPILR